MFSNANFLKSPSLFSQIRIHPSGEFLYCRFRLELTLLLDLEYFYLPCSVSKSVKPYVVAGNVCLCLV